MDHTSYVSVPNVATALNEAGVPADPAGMDKKSCRFPERTPVWCVEANNRMKGRLRISFTRGHFLIQAAPIVVAVVGLAIRVEQGVDIRSIIFPYPGTE